jgi:hypothetical protein
MRKNKMSTSQRLYDSEITPERIAEITRRARIERSQALWRILGSLFRSRASDDLPETLQAAAGRRC